MKMQQVIKRHYSYTYQSSKDVIVGQEQVGNFIKDAIKIAYKPNSGGGWRLRGCRLK